MRFACQSCGKAYNLPEERIAEKSNVKLKCRVCGAIVEVKRQGELVAHLLDETENRPLARVSEAPAPLTSITPEDEDDPEGATVSISEGSINDRDRPLLYEGTPLAPGLEMPLVPAAPPTGFSAALSAGSPPPLGSDAGAQRLDAANVAPPLPPPPLSPSSLPPPPPLRPGNEILPNGASGGSVVTSVAAVTSGKLPPPGFPGGNLPLSNGSSNGASAFFPEVSEDLTPELKAPVAPSGAPSAGGNGSGANALSQAASSPAVLAPAAISSELGDLAVPPSETARDPMFKLKMLAAFATGVLIDRIVSGLFQ
jgi:hypothetical protein